MPEFHRTVVDAREERKEKVQDFIDRIVEKDWYGEITLTFKAGNIVHIDTHPSVDVDNPRIIAI